MQNIILFLPNQKRNEPPFVPISPKKLAHAAPTHIDGKKRIGQSSEHYQRFEPLVERRTYICHPLTIGHQP